MGLSARERAGSRKLLELLDTADVWSLAGTVTKKKSTAFTRAGAIDIILENSQSAYELLNRKKVIRDIIVAYLRNEGVPIPPKITKAEAVQKTLAHWSELEIITSVTFFQDTNPFTSAPKQEMVSNTSVRQHQKVSSDVTSSELPFDFSKMSIHRCQKEDRKEQKSTSQPWHPQLLNKKVSQPPSVHQSAHDKRNTREVVTSLSAAINPVPHMATHSMLQNTQQPTSFQAKTEKVSAIPCTGVMTVPHTTTRSMLRTERQTANFEAKGEKVAAAPYTGITHVPHMTTQSMLQAKRQHANFEAKNVIAVATPYTIATEEDTSFIWPIDCENFTVDFCKWFYTLLNSQQSSGPQNKDWGPQHFLQNAALQLTYMSSTSKYNGGRSVSSCLLALIQDNKLYFQPNITSRGVKCEKSPKGMVVVTVAGTVFRNKSYLGTFDQVFEVVGNSRINNWKIRYVDLKILKSY